MAKSRMLRPEFWTDEKVVSLSPLGRLLFLGICLLYTSRCV